MKRRAPLSPERLRKAQERASRRAFDRRRRQDPVNERARCPDASAAARIPPPEARSPGRTAHLIIQSGQSLTPWLDEAHERGQSLLPNFDRMPQPSELDLYFIETAEKHHGDDASWMFEP